MDKQQKILVVDDEPINIDVLTGLLKQDYKLIVAKNGERALKAAHSGDPDLILLDIMMPDMDGYEVCRRLKADESTRDIPVIFITAMNQAGDETLGFELGAADYITKPVSPPILKARVKTQLALAQSRKELQAAYATIKTQKDRMEVELNVGRDIQMSMMPQDFPSGPGCESFSLYARLEAARELGGDFYDFFFLDESTLCFCVGDVSGKGVPAALFMAVTKTLIRSSASISRSTAAILSRVNATLSADNEGCMFVTLFVAVCNIHSGKVTYTNAGHNPPHIIDASGNTVRLDKRHGPVAGAMDDIVYREDSVVLKPGDTLLMYTDGITEATSTSGQLFSEARLVGLLKQSSQQAVESLVGSIVSSVHSFEGDAEQADDITVLAFGFHGEQHSDSQPERVRKTWTGLQASDDVIVWFEAFADAHALDVSIRRKFKLVFDELLSNVISYAYPDSGVGDIEVELGLEHGALVITLTDDGVPFDPLDKSRPDIHKTVDERDIGGLGIHLCRELMDDVSYQRSAERNIVTLRSRLAV
jgi:sigma-B regulation protein RsbU (phosphoserine phosphatase)